MALAVASGSFLTPTSVNATFAVTGVGFQGKLLLLWGGRHATGLGSHADAQMFIGAAASSTQRWSCGTSWADAVGTAVTSRTQNLTRCYRETTTGTTTLIDIDFVSFDSDGFTLNVSTTDATASRVFYLVLGGADLTNVFVGNFDVTNSTPVAITGVGFQPDLLLLAGAQNFRTSSSTEGNATNSALTLGVSRSASSRWTGGVKSPTGAASPGGHGVMRSDFDLWSIDPSTTNADITLDLASFDADGFTHDLGSGSANTRGVLYIALKGTYQAKVGTITQKTSAGTQAYTGVGFQPSALLLWSTSRTVSTTVTVDGKLSLGVALSTSNRRVSAMAEDNNDPSITDSHASETKAIVHLTAGTPTVDAEADLSTFDGDGFTLNWTTADAVARETGYLALASAAAAGGPPGRHLLLQQMGM